MSQNNTSLYSILIALLFVSACSSQPSSRNHEAQTVLTNSVSSQPVQLPLHDDSPTEHKIIRINHHKVECEGYWVDQCLLYQEEGDTDWRYLYEDIEGFNYEWGHAYELMVEVEQAPAIEGLADQLTTIYRLSHILTDTHTMQMSRLFIRPGTLRLY